MEAGEYKSVIGLDSLYVAEVTADSAAAYTAGTPEWLAPAAEASAEPTTSTETQYADDQPYEVMSSEGETKIGLKVTGIPLEMLAKINGRVWDATTGRLYDNAGVPPYFALSFRSQKSNGEYRYFQYLKGRFDMPKDDIATLGEKPEPKLAELTYTAIRTVHEFDLGDINDSVKRVIGDTDVVAFSEASWFSQVQVPGVVAPSALALASSVPTDGASTVSVSANQTLTFNNALKSTAGITLVKADGTVVDGTISLDTTKKIVTINPTANLDGSSVYIIVYAVEDVYGQTLVGAVNFTTA